MAGWGLWVLFAGVRRACSTYEKLEGSAMRANGAEGEENGTGRRNCMP